MAGRQRGGLARELEDAAERFARWRRTRARGARIPEPLWNLAVELASHHGISRTASALRVGYYELQKRAAERPDCGRAEPQQAPATPRGFVEVTPVALGECVVEFEKASGLRMRVQFKGGGWPDLVALGRSFWDAD